MSSDSQQLTHARSVAIDLNMFFTRLCADYPSVHVGEWEAAMIAEFIVDNYYIVRKPRR